jgi:hypothetical protein
MIAEGSKHPDLVQWYWDNVVSRAIKALRSLFDKGVENGEFRKSALNEFPQLLVTPVLFSTVFTIVLRRTWTWCSIPSRQRPHEKVDDNFLLACVDLARCL